MEAMAAGLPVLGTDCIGLREVLRGTPARAARANDPESLAGELRRALEDPRTAEARAFAPAARVRFDRRGPARRLLDLFDQLVAGRRR
jgi:glycosyltransferase involved in cell wall biosynthesis